MENYSVTEMIEQAIQTEELGYHFYTNMSVKFHEHNELKELFSRLAGMEIEHKATFTKMMAEIEHSEIDNDGWEEVSHYMRAMVESEFFLGKHKVLPSMEKAVTVKDAIKRAINFEKETLLYFIGLRDVVAQKDIVDKIIDEERSHIKWLSAFSCRMTG
jgi:rubrerythrin